MDSITFQSAIDRWFYPLIIGGPLASVAIIGAFTGQFMVHLLIGAAASAFVTLAVIPFTRPCQYRVDAEYISVQSGFLKFQISLRSIRELRKVRSWISAPCLSIDRVLIITETGKEMVSPKNRDEFIHHLQKLMRKAAEPGATDNPDGAQ